MVARRMGALPLAHPAALKLLHHIANNSSDLVLISGFADRAATYRFTRKPLGGEQALQLIAQNAQVGLLVRRLRLATASGFDAT